MNRTRLLVAVGGWFAIWLALAASDARPSAVALAGVALGSSALVGTVVDVGRSVARVPWHRPRRPRGQDRGDDPRVIAFRRWLAAERSTASTEIDDRLVRTVDARLMSRFGIDRRAHPDAARAVLTPSLQQLVSGSPRRTTSRRARVRQLDQVLNDLEAL